MPSVSCLAAIIIGWQQREGQAGQLTDSTSSSQWGHKAARQGHALRKLCVRGYLTISVESE